MVAFKEGDTTETDLFTRLETASEEPLLSNAREKALIFNTLLSEANQVTVDSLRSIVEELDSEIYPFMSSKATVSGIVRFKNPYTDGIEETYFDDLDVTFQGFVVVKKELSDAEYSDTFIEEDLITGEKIVVGKQQVAICAHVPSKSLIENCDPDLDQYTLVVSVDIGASVEFGAISPDRARAWLETSYPDAINELDQFLYSSDFEQEGELLDRLKDFKIDVTDVEDVYMLQHCLEVYINTALPFDKEVPYSCCLDGAALVDEGDIEGYREAYVSSNDEPRLVFINRIMCIVSSDKDVSMMGLYAEINALTKDHTAVSQVAVVHLGSIKNAMSIRYAYYS
jgi:hypothetical protein